jgi:hypothetical protein
MGCRAVLIKGGHGQGAESIDYLVNPRSGTVALASAAHRHQKHPRHRMLAVIGHRGRPCEGRGHGNRGAHAKPGSAPRSPRPIASTSATATDRSIIFIGFRSRAPMSRINYSTRFTIGARGADMNLRSRGKAEARFAAYVEGLSSVLGHADRIGPLRDYCTGLILPGERKSVEPMAAKTAPARTAAQHQSLLHFVGVATWSDEKVLAKVRDMVLPSMNRHGPIEAWIIDDTGFPKQGAHSVGVQHQYCGQLGKEANCQVAVSLSIANHSASLPVAYRLYLPKDWASDNARRGKAGVPSDISFNTKPEIALEQIRWACETGLPRGVVLMDAAYGTDSRLRTGMTTLGVIPSASRIDRRPSSGCD